MEGRLTSRAWVEVDLDSIGKNVREIKKRLPPGVHFMAVVKANAYGHGSVPVAVAALEAGATWLGVATVEEGVELRKAGIKAPILILGLICDEFAEDMVRWDLAATICSEEAARAISAAALRQGKVARAHLKVDTGMGRIGLQRWELLPFLRKMRELSLPALDIEGIFMHFATADEEDRGYALEQFALFQEMLKEARSEGFVFRLRHAANSAATIYLPQTAMDMVRVGISLYGYGCPPSRRKDEGVHLIPALQFKARVMQVKTVPPGAGIGYGRTYIASEEMRVATLAVGYGDGYSRSLSNKGEVIIRGRMVPIIGRVCMDQCMVRIPRDLPVARGEEAILIGRQGAVEITADDVAAKMGTISHEVLSMISQRVKRIYYKGRRSDPEDFKV